jgi:hypothetical protein
MPLRLVPTFSLFIALAATSAPHAALIAQPTAPTIVGAWVLNPGLTQRPEEIGFSAEWARAQGSGGEGGGRSRGGRGGVPSISRTSAEDATRVQQLTGDARTPPSRLTIIQKDSAIAIADDQGRARTFRPDGRLEELTIGTVPLLTTARWDGASLVVVYEVETGRQLRYTYTPSADPTRLQVNIRFLERGREGDEVRLTYEPPDAHERAIVSGAQASQPAAPSASASTPPGVPDGAPPSARPPVLPPGSELRGLTTIGTVVEDLSAEGKACGLDREKIQTSIARILADAGFKTERFGNEDTSVFLSVVTSRLPDGTCVSRYDASLVTQADATFPYLKGLVAVPVQLLHEGGMAGGSPTSHASAVMDALVKSANRFVSQIRAANKSVGARWRPPTTIVSRLISDGRLYVRNQDILKVYDIKSPAIP